MRAGDAPVPGQGVRCALSRSSTARVLVEAVSVQHAAIILDVHVNTIYNWIESGVVIAVHIGPRLLRIPRSEIARLRSGVTAPNSTQEAPPR